VTVTRYTHPDPERGWELIRIAYERARQVHGERALFFISYQEQRGFLTPEEQAEYIVDTAPSEEHLSVRDVLIEWAEPESTADIRAGKWDETKVFNLAVAAYRAGRSDCDCSDY
jgi:hypothetical protein